MRKAASIASLFALCVGLVSQLPAQAEPRPRIYRSPYSHTPRFVTGIQEGVRSGNPRQAGYSHLRANLGRYAIADPARDLRFHETTGPRRAPTVAFDQLHGGIPVFGARYLVHLRDEGEGFTTTSVNGHLFSELSAPTTPAFSEAAARSLVAPRLRPAVVQKIDSHGLTVVPRGAGVLAYHFTAWGSRLGAPLKQEVFINARTGSVALSYNDLQAEGPTTGTGMSVFGETVPLEIFEVGNPPNATYELRDRSRAMFPSGQITTHDAKGRDFYVGTTTNIVKSSSTVFPSSATQSGAVDAHVNAGRVYEYYLGLGRDSLDGQGGSIVSTVNATEFGLPMFNAFWDGAQMVYGNPAPSQLHPLSAALDVVGHEMTHAVTQYSGDLVYLDQSGAMNEAYSDYFGEAIEIETTGLPMDDPAAGEVGEDVCKVADPDEWECPLRDLNDDTTTADYVYYLADFDSGGVHLNSTIFGGALWDIREAIGAKADEYVYTALTQYTTPLDDFVDGRLAVLAAAEAVGAPPPHLDAINEAFTNKGIVAGWDVNTGNDANLVLEDVAPIGQFFSPPQVSGGRFIIGDYANKTDLCCKALQIYVGNVDGPVSLKKVGEDANRFTFNDEMPDISGRRAVWAHLTMGAAGFDMDVHSRVLGGRVQEIADARDFQWFPSISGKLIAWEDLRSGQTDIWARYVGKKPFKVTGASGEQWQPQVRGDWIAWWDVGGPNSQPKVRVRNASTGKLYTYLPSSRRGIVGPPGLGPDHIYWFEDSDGDGINAIKRAKLGTSRVTTVVSERSNVAPVYVGVTAPSAPSVNRRWLAYTDEYGYALEFTVDPDAIPSDRVGRDIFIVRASGGTPRLVTSNRGDQAYPAFAGSGRKLLWLDSSQGRTDLLKRIVP